MTIRKCMTLILLWALSLIIVGAFAHAKTPAPQPFTQTTPRGSTDARILSGSDVGFRVERTEKDVVSGTWMVRINGKWIPAEPVERAHLQY